MFKVTYWLPLLLINSLFIIAMALPGYAQSSPLTEDQDGDGNPLNEERDISWNCFVDKFASNAGQSLLGIEIEGTLTEDDCDFIMHYLSGQCEEQTAAGVNVTEVCNTTLSNYLEDRGLYTKDFPTDTERFNAMLVEFKQKTASEEQEEAQEEANKPSWAENLE